MLEISLKEQPTENTEISHRRSSDRKKFYFIGFLIKDLHKRKKNLNKIREPEPYGREHWRDISRCIIKDKSPL